MAKSNRKITELLHTPNTKVHHRSKKKKKKNSVDWKVHMQCYLPVMFKPYLYWVINEVGQLDAILVIHTV